MPIYEYVCTACDHRADILHGLNDPGPNFCLSCGREGTMRKQFAPPTIHYKGSGWAKKDRSSKPSRATGATDAARDKGDTGDKGDAGGKGETGETGDRGGRGDKGEKAKRGDAASGTDARSAPASTTAADG